MKTKKEILEETANFYNSSNRAYTSNDGCTYLTNEGKMCAVGRCLVNPQIFMDDQIGTVNNTKEGYLESHLKEEYRGHPMVFWNRLQSFHDGNNNWNGNGMSEEGKVNYKTILKFYC